MAKPAQNPVCRLWGEPITAPEKPVYLSALGNRIKRAAHERCREDEIRNSQWPERDPNWCPDDEDADPAVNANPLYDRIADLEAQDRRRHKEDYE